MPDSASVRSNPSFRTGTLVRLDGLQAAAELNGVKAMVQRYVRDKDRYEVQFTHNGKIESKAVKIGNMFTLPQMEEVEVLRDELKAAGTPPSISRVIIDRLGWMQVQAVVLINTKVGKVVSDFGKSTSDPELSRCCRALVDSWKQTWRQQKEARAEGSTQSKPASKVDKEPSKGQAEAELPQPAPTSLPASSPSYDAETLVNLLKGVKDAEELAGILQELTSVKCTDDYRSAFIANGGLKLVRRFISKRPRVRPECLKLLEVVTLTAKQIEEAQLHVTISDIPDIPAHVKQQALGLLDAWRKAGCLPEPVKEKQNVDKGDPPLKRRRVDAAIVQGTDVNGADKEREKTENAEPQRHDDADAGLPLPPTDSLFLADLPEESDSDDGEVQQEPVLDETNFPTELAHLPVHIKDFLARRPKTMSFLVTHPAVCKNMTVDTLKFLRRTVERNQKTEAEARQKVAEPSLVRNFTLQLGNLDERAHEAQIFQMLQQYNLGFFEVNLPRETRKKRSCRTAQVVLRSKEALDRALAVLEGQMFWSKRLHVDSLERIAQSRRSRQGTPDRRIKWRNSKELMQVAVYEAQEPVEAFGDRLRSQGTTTHLQSEPIPTGSKNLFLAAAKAEHEEERSLTSQAFDDYIARPVV